MDSLLNNQKILVVGAGGLLGAHVVKSALEHGALVIAADLNVNQMVNKLKAQKINCNSKGLELVELDLNNELNVKEFFECRSDISGAVNCSYPRNKTYGKHFFDVSLDSFNENVSLHLGSAFLLTQQCAAYFVKNRQPFSLVNISSIYGVIAPKFDIYENTPMTMPVEYAAIKSAILHLNKYISSYVKDSRFRINSVSPGGIFDNQLDVFLNAYLKKTHGAGMLNVDDIIDSILFLLSNSSRYVTGQNIIVDDGFTL